MGLNLILRNYMAVEEANVELSDLTVLAGVNGSGKSTVVRMFHRLVCLESDLSRYASDVAYAQLDRAALSPLATVLPELFDTKSFSWPTRVSAARFPASIEKLRIGFHNYVRSEEVRERLRDARLTDALARAVNSANVPSLARAGDLGELNGWFDHAVEACLTAYNLWCARGAGSSNLFFSASVAGGDMSSFGVPKGSGTLLEKLYDDCPQPFLQFSDGNVPIIQSQNRDLPLPSLYTPRQSFYIARPAADFPSLSASKLKFNGMEYPIRGRAPTSEECAKIPSGIESLMGGAVSAPREKPYIGSGDWLFSDGQGDAFGLSACADGIKSLATVSILDRYGLLNDGTLLIIDEPEVHLHPQWIVGMAHVLVRLAKYRKVRVLITTHSPDMIHALRDFSENENFGANTRFYLSARDPQSTGGYRFKSLGQDIGPIFEVFNQAKENIYSISKSLREGKAI